MDIFKSGLFLITCGRGIVPYLCREIEQLGYKVHSTHDTGLEIKTSFHDAARLNLCLRTALRVMYLLKKFDCTSAVKLYDEVASLPWEDLIDPSEYVSVVSVIDAPYINNSMFANQKVKDAIVDRLNEKCGERPCSGPILDNVVINLFCKDSRAWIYLDTSGNKLSDRSYRKMPHKAPLQETLAAALLLATGYDGSTPLVIPMCGSGTLAIEAALIALRRAPGLLRDNFGLMHVKNFDKPKWDALRREMSVAVRKHLPSRIIASDIDKRAVEAAKKNAQNAGVDRLIDFYVSDFSDTPIPQEKGIVIFNPEYGLRLGDDKELEQTYTNIGDFLKKECTGFTGYIFTGNMDLAKKIGLRTSRRLVFFNAQIECRLLEYQLYQGSKKG